MPKPVSKKKWSRKAKILAAAGLGAAGLTGAAGLALLRRRNNQDKDLNGLPPIRIGDPPPGKGVRLVDGVKRVAGRAAKTLVNKLPFFRASKDKKKGGPPKTPFRIPFFRPSK